MYYKLTMLAGVAGVLAVAAFVGDAFAADAGHLLNQANTINYNEMETAKTARSKDGDNQSLITYAETLKADHEANEEAVNALATQKNIKLESTLSDADKAEKKTLDKLDGGAFNAAFLQDEIKDHEKALKSFRSARSRFQNDPAMKVYIDQTIPILEAHLQMAKNLQDQLGTNGNENPANNKKQ